MALVRNRKALTLLAHCLRLYMAPQDSRKATGRTRPDPGRMRPQPFAPAMERNPSPRAPPC